MLAGDDDDDDEEEHVPKHGCRSTDADLSLLFENLGTKSGVLSLAPKFFDNYVQRKFSNGSHITARLIILEAEI